MVKLINECLHEWLVTVEMWKLLVCVDDNSFLAGTVYL